MDIGGSKMNDIDENKTDKNAGFLDQVISNFSVSSSREFPDYFSCATKISPQVQTDKEMIRFKEKDIDVQKEIAEYLSTIYEKREKMEDVKDKAAGGKSAKFKDWKNLVSNNFNLLFYGMGSKFLLMKKFATQRLAKIGNVIFVNGASATVTLKQIIGKLVHLVNTKYVQTSRTIPGRINEELLWLESHLSLKDIHKKMKPIVLVFHCLDVIVGVDPDNRAKLSKIAQLLNVRIVASIENSRAFTSWDSVSLSDLHFVYIQEDTYLPYSKQERFFLDYYIKKQEVKERGFMYIYQSLTKTQKDILKIMAEYQLELPEEGGLTFDQLFRLAQEKMVVSNQKQLKDCLNEGRDQKIIVDKEQGDGKTHILLSLPLATLDRLVSNKF